MTEYPPVAAEGATPTARLAWILPPTTTRGRLS